MRESKTAEFKDIELKATLVDGSLEKVAVYGNGETHEPMVLDAKETGELYLWLGTLGFGRGLTLPQPAQAAADQVPDYLLSGLPRVAPAAGLVPAEKRISDAESVKNRVPLSQVLASGGMRLEERVVAPLQVTFPAGAPKK